MFRIAVVCCLHWSLETELDVGSIPGVLARSLVSSFMLHEAFAVAKQQQVFSVVICREGSVGSRSGSFRLCWIQMRIVTLTTHEHDTRGFVDGFFFAWREKTSYADIATAQF